MNKKEIAEVLREEVGLLEVSIQKTQARCERMKQIVLALEEEIELEENRGRRKDGPAKEIPNKMRVMIDRVFGEKPKRRKP